MSTYKPFLTHLSSWGFISVGNDDENTRTGASLEETIKFLIAENEKKDSIFYHKIDLDNIGIAGHSQGGPAVFNMVTNQEHGSMLRPYMRQVQHHLTTQWLWPMDGNMIFQE